MGSRECKFHVIFKEQADIESNDCPMPSGYNAVRKYGSFEQCVDLEGDLKNDKASSANVQGKSGLQSSLEKIILIVAVCCVIYPEKGCKKEGDIRPAVVHNLDQNGKQRMAITGPDMASSLKCKKMEKAGDCDGLM